MIRQYKVGVVTTGIMSEIIVSSYTFTEAKSLALRMTGADYVTGCQEIL